MNLLSRPAFCLVPLPLSGPQSLPSSLPGIAGAPPARALRQRPIEAVARAACTTFLGDDAVTVQLDDGGGRRWCEGLATLRREYHARRTDLQRRHGGQPWLWNLQYEMGLRAMEALACSLWHLFDIRADDFARRALAMECVAALADSTLTASDETGVLAHASHRDAAPAPRATKRTLTLSRVAPGRVALHKETRWDGAALPGLPVKSGVAAADRHVACLNAIRASSFDATLNLAVLRPAPWRTGDDGRARRARLRCKIAPVQLHGDADAAGAPHTRACWRHRLALLAGIVRHLFHRLIGNDGALRSELRLLVHADPRGLLPPSAVVVGQDWRSRQSTQPLCHAVWHGYNDMRRTNEQLRQQRYRSDAVDQEPPPRSDDGVRLY